MSADYTLRRALVDFQSFYKGNDDYGWRIGGDTKTSSQFSITTNLNSYIICDGKLHSFYNCKEALLADWNALSSRDKWYGQVDGGAKLEVSCRSKSKRCASQVVSLVQQFGYQFKKSIEHYTNLVYDIGCPETVSYSTEDDGKYYKMVDHLDRVKMVKMANPPNEMKQNFNWTPASQQDWDMMDQLNQGIIEYEFVWLGNGIRHWVMTLRASNGDMSFFYEQLLERIV